MLIAIGLKLSTVSALLEEFVWRGNIYYYLRKVFNFSATSFIISAIWSIWHLPIALLYKPYDQVVPVTLIYFALLFILSLVICLFREKSGSVLPATIVHGPLNVFYLSDGLRMTVSVSEQELVKLLVCFLVLIFCICYYTSKHKPLIKLT
ncbi:CPBP family intramembrane glutamic endopeptidase [Solibacillus sp. FSL H8-0538]|uniref:CPBP family intramembrane glutamic endopeptidase n=1 Tax=Solibacillus sp. FSL H8-0538 TaxID=2921400 RepID=UPI0030F9B32D